MEVFRAGGINVVDVVVGRRQLREVHRVDWVRTVRHVGDFCATGVRGAVVRGATQGDVVVVNRAVRVVVVMHAAVGNRLQLAYVVRISGLCAASDIRYLTFRTGSP